MTAPARTPPHHPHVYTRAPTHIKAAIAQPNWLLVRRIRRQHRRAISSIGCSTSASCQLDAARPPQPCYLQIQATNKAALSPPVPQVYPSTPRLPCVDSSKKNKTTQNQSVKHPASRTNWAIQRDWYLDNGPPERSWHWGRSRHKPPTTTIQLSTPQLHRRPIKH